jgi:MFS family permease
VAGCFVSGMISSAFYALVPAWMLGAGVTQQTIALFMLVAVLGGLALQVPVGRLSDRNDRRIVLTGLALQVPVGRLSDRNDRRIVLTGLALGFAAAAVLLVLVPPRLAVVLPVAAVLGGFMSTLYPVCVAHALDRMPADRVVAVSGRLVLVSGIGSALGPIFGAAAMGRFDISGLLVFMAAAAVVLAAVAGLRVLVRAAPEHVERPFDLIDPLTAPITQEPQATQDDGTPRPLPA